jgi:endonuclease/exonuclease/phosphatase family metal-dependent hydrolase
MTANLAGQLRFGWEARKEAALKILRDHKPDIIGFQEFGVTNWDDLKAAIPQHLLAEGREAGDIFMNCIAENNCQFDALDFETFWLTPDGTYGKAWGGAERGATWLRVRDRKIGKEFLILNTHLDNRSAQARTKATDVIIKFLENWHIPVIITADSNVSVDSPDDRWKDPLLREPYDKFLASGFTDCWTATHPGEQRPQTFHAFQGDKYVLDRYGTWDTEWILVRGFTPVSCSLITESVDGIYPSDHYWMTAKIAFET